MKMYKKQKDIFNSIVKKPKNNHLIVNSNGVGVSTLLLEVFKYLKENSNRKIFVSGLEITLNNIFKDINFNKIDEYNISSLDEDSTIIAFDYINSKIVKRANKIKCNIIKNTNTCITPDIENYEYLYLLNAFDLPAFKNIKLEDIINNTYKDKIVENKLNKYFINPDEVYKIFVDNGKDINSFEFRTRILGGIVNVR